MSEGSVGNSKIAAMIRRATTALAYRLAPRLTTKTLYKNMRHEREMIFLPLLCDRMCISLDIGANIGLYSLYMAKHSLKVLSFEPQTHIFNHLARRMPKAVEVSNCALSDVNGMTLLRVPSKGRAFGTIEAANALGGKGAVCTQRVKTKKLDDLALPGPVGFIKIDVEGHELAVLRGGLTVLRRDRPQLLIEIEERHRPHSLEEVGSLLGGMSYTGHFFDGYTLRPITEFDTDHHQRPGVQLYINNFLFLTGDRMKRIRGSLPNSNETVFEPPQHS